MTRDDMVTLLQVRRKAAVRTQNVIRTSRSYTMRGFNEKQLTGEFVTQLRRASQEVTLTVEARTFLHAWFNPDRWLAPNIPLTRWFNEEGVIEPPDESISMEASLESLDHLIAEFTHINMNAVRVRQGLEDLALTLEA